MGMTSRTIRSTAWFSTAGFLREGKGAELDIKISGMCGMFPLPVWIHEVYTLRGGEVQANASRLEAD
jgi:hypothetical protein